MKKIVEQLADNQEELVNSYDYVFSENGLVAFKNGSMIGEQSIQAHLGDELLQKLINFCLKYISNLELPRKRGTFIEFRKGMINACPVGRSCTQAEREEFYAFDCEHKVRQLMVEKLREEFKDEDLTFSIGGQISIDIFPTGWVMRFFLMIILLVIQLHLLKIQEINLENFSTKDCCYMTSYTLNILFLFCSLLLLY